MSQPINDGGPAFPTNATATTHGFYQDGQPCATHYGTTPGMTLRDYFAAAIMQGLMASQCEVTDDPYPIYAYKIADAMLKAREVKP
jgi:hypothetical protein